MPFTLPVAFFSQDSSNTINYTVTYSIAPDVGTFSSTSALSQDGTKSISADGITFQSNNSNIVADCAKIQLDTDRDEYRDVTVTLTITDGSKTKTVSKVLTGISAFSVSNLNQTIFTNEDVNPTLTTMVVTDSSDVSATGDVTVTITNNNTSAATLSSSAGTYNSSTGVYTLTDSIANVNTALAALTVSLTANFNGDISLTTAFNDTGSVHTANGQIDITVVSINDAPTWSNVVNYTYNDTDSTFSYNGPEVADIDNDVITMTAALQDNIGTLSSNQAGVTQNNNQTLIAVGLPATINNVLDNLTFNKTGTGQSSIIFYANDGTANVNQTSSLLFERNINASITPTMSATSSIQGTYHLSGNIQTTSSVTGQVFTPVNLTGNVLSTSSVVSNVLNEVRYSSDIDSSSTVATPKLTGTYHLHDGIQPVMARSSVTGELILQPSHISNPNIISSATVSFTAGLPHTYKLVDTVTVSSGETLKDISNAGRFVTRASNLNSIEVYDHTSFNWSNTPTTIFQSTVGGALSISNDGNALINSSGSSSGTVKIYNFSSGSWSNTKTESSIPSLNNAFMNGAGDRAWFSTGNYSTIGETTAPNQSFFSSGTWGSFSAPSGTTSVGDQLIPQYFSKDTKIIGYRSAELSGGSTINHNKRLLFRRGQLDSVDGSWDSDGNAFYSFSSINTDNSAISVSIGNDETAVINVLGSINKCIILQNIFDTQAVTTLDGFGLLSGDGNFIHFKDTSNNDKILQKRDGEYKEIQDLGNIGSVSRISQDGSIIAIQNSTSIFLYK